MVIINGYNVVKVDKAINFSGVYVRPVDEYDFLKSLENGYYLIEGVNQYFKIKEIDYTPYGGKVEKKFISNFMESNVISEYLNKLQKEKEKIEKAELSEKIEKDRSQFIQDLETPLVFDENNVAVMKDYYFKNVKVVRDLGEDYVMYEVLINGSAMCDIFTLQNGEFSAYDGVNGYKDSKTVKGAIKNYMDWEYKYPSLNGDDDDDYEVQCTNCGDGGCLYCEPHRFL